MYSKVLSHGKSPPKTSYICLIEGLKVSSLPRIRVCVSHSGAQLRYGPTYLVLDLLQKVFYTSDAARESFVELCEEEYVQKALSLSSLIIYKSI